MQQIPEKLQHWQFQHNEHSDKAGSALIRVFEFTSFLEAMQFMSDAAAHIDKTDHHPQWENVSKRVKVKLSTWDAGNTVSDLDIALAIYLEDLYNTSYKPKNL
jgi:4a-hydroxytetrahydrobiopterin dehydratase